MTEEDKQKFYIYSIIILDDFIEKLISKTTEIEKINLYKQDRIDIYNLILDKIKNPSENIIYILCYGKDVLKAIEVNIFNPNFYHIHPLIPQEEDRNRLNYKNQVQICF